MKGLRRAEKALVAFIVLAIAVHFVGPVDRRVRNASFLPDMAASPAYGSQEANPVFEDGKTLQPPPAGTIPRGALPLHAGGRRLAFEGAWDDLSEEARADWDGLASPLAPLEEDDRAAARARGAEVFRRVCVSCHGAGGAGDGPVTKRGVPPPPSLLAEQARGYSDGRLFRIISSGQGNMEPLARHLTKEDRWTVVLYLRSLQEE